MKKMICFFISLLVFVILFFTKYSTVNLVTSILDLKNLTSELENNSKVYSENQENLKILDNEVKSMLNLSHDFIFDYMSMRKCTRIDLVDFDNIVIQENIDKSTPNVDYIRFTFSTKEPVKLLNDIKSNNIVVVNSNYSSNSGLFYVTIYCKDGGIN